MTKDILTQQKAVNALRKTPQELQVAQWNKGDDKTEIKQ